MKQLARIQFFGKNTCEIFFQDPNGRAAGDSFYRMPETIQAEKERNKVVENMKKELEDTRSEFEIAAEKRKEEKEKQIDGLVSASPKKSERLISLLREHIDTDGERDQFILLLTKINGIQNKGLQEELIDSVYESISSLPRVADVEFKYQEDQTLEKVFYPLQNQVRLLDITSHILDSEELIHAFDLEEHPERMQDFDNIFTALRGVDNEDLKKFINTNKDIPFSQFLGRARIMAQLTSKQSSIMNSGDGIEGFDSWTSLDDKRAADSAEIQEFKEKIINGTFNRITDGEALKAYLRLTKSSESYVQAFHSSDIEKETSEEHQQKIKNLTMFLDAVEQQEWTEFFGINEYEDCLDARIALEKGDVPVAESILKPFVEEHLYKWANLKSAELASKDVTIEDISNNSENVLYSLRKMKQYKKAEGLMAASIIEGMDKEESQKKALDSIRKDAEDNQPGKEEAKKKFDTMFSRLESADPLLYEQISSGGVDTAKETFINDYIAMKALDNYVIENGTDGLGKLGDVYNDMKGLEGFGNLSDTRKSAVIEWGTTIALLFVPGIGFGPAIALGAKGVRLAGAAARSIKTGASTIRILRTTKLARALNAVRSMKLVRKTARMQAVIKNTKEVAKVSKLARWEVPKGPLNLEQAGAMLSEVGVLERTVGKVKMLLSAEKFSEISAVNKSIKELRGLLKLDKLTPRQGHLITSHTNKIAEHFLKLEQMSLGAAIGSKPQKAWAAAREFLVNNKLGQYIRSTMESQKVSRAESAAAGIAKEAEKARRWKMAPAGMVSLGDELVRFGEAFASVSKLEKVMVQIKSLLTGTKNAKELVAMEKSIGRLKSLFDMKQSGKVLSAKEVALVNSEARAVAEHFLKLEQMSLGAAIGSKSQKAWAAARNWLTNEGGALARAVSTQMERFRYAPAAAVAGFALMPNTLDAFGIKSEEEKEGDKNSEKKKAVSKTGTRKKEETKTETIKKEKLTEKKIPQKTITLPNGEKRDISKSLKSKTNDAGAAGYLRIRDADGKDTLQRFTQTDTFSIVKDSAGNPQEKPIDINGKPEPMILVKGSSVHRDSGEVKPQQGWVSKNFIQ